MTPAKFKELCAAVRRTWTPQGGAVALLTTPGGRRTLRLVAGRAGNRELVATTCRLWRGDDVLYDGALESAELKKLLTANGMARARVTTAARLDSPPRRGETLSLTRTGRG